MNLNNEEIATELGYWFFEQETGADVQERVVKATKSIKDLCITDINFDNGTLTITLRRPGLIIGRRGVLIDKLNQDFQVKSKGEIKEIKIVEYKGPLERLFDFTYINYAFELDEP